MGNNIIHGFLKLISAVQKLRCCSRWPSHNRKKLCKTHSKSISHAKLPFLSSLSLSSNQKNAVHRYPSWHPWNFACHQWVQDCQGSVAQRAFRRNCTARAFFFLVALLPPGNHGILFPNPFLYSYPSAGSLGLATWLWASQCCLETGRFTCFATKLTFQPVAASSQGKKPVTSSGLGRQPGAHWTKQDILPKGLWVPSLRGTTRVIPGNCWSKAVLISSADQAIGKLLMWSWSAIPQKFWRVSVEDYF